MKEADLNNEKSETLRTRAETFLLKEASAIKEMPAVDIQDLIEDLRVHQVELEMQGEELLRSQLEHQEARDRYADLYDFAPVGYVTISENGIILEANLTAANLLKEERSVLIGMPISHFIVKQDHDLFYHHRKFLLKSGQREA